MEIVELKNIITGKKKQPLVDGPNSRMEGQRKEFVIWKINQ